MDYEKPFVEKYRPQSLDDIVGNASAIDHLKAIAEKGNSPNLILVVSIFIKLILFKHKINYPAI